MVNQIEYAIMNSGEEGQAIDIVVSTFNEFVAPEYSNEGVAEFFKYANAEALAERSQSGNLTLIAKENHKPIGIIEIKDYSHVSMLFVKKSFQNRGIGKSLLRSSIQICKKNRPDIEKVTVNSSPNSVKAYEKMGFFPDNTEQCINGIRFTAMSLTLK